MTALSQLPQKEICILSNEDCVGKAMRIMDEKKLSAVLFALSEKEWSLAEKGDLFFYPKTRILLDCHFLPLPLIENDKEFQDLLDLFMHSGSKYCIIVDNSGHPQNFIAESEFYQLQEKTTINKALFDHKQKLDLAMEAGKLAWFTIDCKTRSIDFGDLKARSPGYLPQDFHKLSDFLDLVHGKQRKLIQKLYEQLLAGEIQSLKQDYQLFCKNGTYQWFRDTAVLHQQNDGYNFIYGISVNIDEQKNKQEQLEKTLEHNRVLLKEIHHRVKNNLQIISSLLSLELKDVKDEIARNKMEECRERIQTISLVHKALYENDDMSRVNFSQYIEKFIDNISRLCDEREIQFYTKIDSYPLSVDYAVPCALIVNELVTNSIKHAFNNRGSGRIDIDFTTLPNQKFRLSVKDNGQGFSEDFDLETLESLGMLLIKNLAFQLDADLKLQNQGGALVSLEFFTGRKDEED